jgi:formylmethanofuran dehydrogenase subunit A
VARQGNRRLTSFQLSYPIGDVLDYGTRGDQETMFELPRYVIKSGVVIVEQGEIRLEFYGKTLHVAPEYDHEIDPDI